MAEILDKSVVRYHSEMDLLNGAATSAEVGGARAEVGEEKGEGGREETDATGNYVNYDIAQTLLEKATRQSLSPPAGQLVAQSVNIIDLCSLRSNKNVGTWNRY